MTYAVTTERSIAMVLLAIVVDGWAIYVFAVSYTHLTLPTKA